MRAGIMAVVMGMAAPALANTSHHASGGGGSSAEAECIRWEPIASDGGALDLGARDLGTGSDLGGGGDALDAGPPLDAGSHAGMRCVERASLFSCAYADDAVSRSAGSGGSRALVGGIFVWLLARARTRRRRGATGRA